MIAFTAIALLALLVAAFYWGIYIIPFLLGMQVFKWMIDSDKTGIDSLFLGGVTGIATFLVLRFIFDHVRSRKALRTIVAIIVLPVMWAGYTGALDVLHDILPSPIFRHAISILIGVACGIMILARLDETYRPRRMKPEKVKTFEAEFIDPEPMEQNPDGLVHAKLLEGPKPTGFFNKRWRS
ncbi:MAG TPA: hypothetical protein VHL08_06130 [Dongiaceae bacterium]|jgi:hypothetical protein|nr:hypothetical protein [Dongiaceae bacterium]